ncbi:hypothetical protein CLOM_g5000 [Closterium sp. NIES-68]|nr:hypothetical protein CLOM_g5000 [Closterium sp. NIES-68]GJP67826.1 hypothetical protein CLOP_g24594 [Closterium sp. NIES-67]
MATLEKVQISGDGVETFDAFVAGEEGKPGVVVLQEWWGVDYEIKNHALSLAAKGFRTLIPDLYKGKVALETAEAQHLMDGLDWPTAIKEIGASAKWLQAHGSKKVGVIGFCMGGALSLMAAINVDSVSAAVSFYGVPEAALKEDAKAKVPVQAHFGELDNFKGFSDVEAARALEKRLEAAGVPHEVHIYPGQGHAFVNASPEARKRKEGMGLPGHDEAAVELAWSRTVDWLNKHL